MVVKNGLVHIVFFWLNNPDSEADRAALNLGLIGLSQIDLVKVAYIGTPADTHREVIDSSYSFAITLVFESNKEQTEYQTHPEHLEFIANCKHLWRKVQVYDIDC